MRASNTYMYDYCNSMMSQTINNLLITTTVKVVLLVPIGLVIVHVYVPLSFIVTLSME